MLLKEQETPSELAKRIELYPDRISQWRREFLEGSERAFEKSRKEEEPTIDSVELFRQIGELHCAMGGYTQGA